MNKQKLTTVSPFAVITAAYQAVSSLQDTGPEEQLAGIAMLLNVMCASTDSDISQVLDQAKRMEHDADSNYTTTVRALRAYVRENL
jgi:hypothetical protein